jgi:hypothetical protein
LDLAHSNAAGVVFKKILDRFDSQDHLPGVIHCNFPGSKLNSGLDRHGWYYKDESPVLEEEKLLWKEVLKKAVSLDIPLIVEGGTSEGSISEEVTAIQRFLEGSNG